MADTEAPVITPDWLGKQFEAFQLEGLRPSRSRVEKLASRLDVVISIYGHEKLPDRPPSAVHQAATLLQSEIGPAIERWQKQATIGGHRNELAVIAIRDLTLLDSLLRGGIADHIELRSRAELEATGQAKVGRRPDRQKHALIAGLTEAILETLIEAGNADVGTSGGGPVAKITAAVLTHVGRQATPDSVSGIIKRTKRDKTRLGKRPAP